MAATKRGAHLALSLERLAHLTAGRPAAHRPVRHPATAVGDRRVPRRGRARGRRWWTPAHARSWTWRSSCRSTTWRAWATSWTSTRPPGGPAAGPEARHSIWPSIHPRLLELIRAHRSTLIFVNSRRLAERLASRLNELAEEELVRAHHGSIAREQRLEIEEQLKQGKLPALVATSSLELGIDMGAIDLVVQIEAPPSVAVGHAAHRSRRAHRRRAQHRQDLPEVPRRPGGGGRRGRADAGREDRGDPHPAQPARRPGSAARRHLRARPLDGRRPASAGDPRRQLPGPVARAARPASSTCSPDATRPTSSPISSRAWSGTARRTRSRRATTPAWSPSPPAARFPDRGLYGVFLPGDDAGRGGRRVGELDEEMVYESRVGETFLLGASTWRIEEIRPDRVIVTPAPGEPGKMPFWHGDAVGRPIELGRAIGAFLRELRADAARGGRGPGSGGSRARRAGGAQPRRLPRASSGR